MLTPPCFPPSIHHHLSRMFIPVHWHATGSPTTKIQKNKYSLVEWQHICSNFTPVLAFASAFLFASTRLGLSVLTFEFQYVQSQHIMYHHVAWVIFKIYKHWFVGMLRKSSVMYIWLKISHIAKSKQLLHDCCSTFLCVSTALLDVHGVSLLLWYQCTEWVEFLCLAHSVKYLCTVFTSCSVTLQYAS